MRVSSWKNGKPLEPPKTGLSLHPIGSAMADSPEKVCIFVTSGLADEDNAQGGINHDR
jgi:hypothetical protein